MKTLHDSIWSYEHESIDEVNDSDTWPKENPNLGHMASYETYQPNDDILAFPVLLRRKSKDECSILCSE